MRVLKNTTGVQRICKNDSIRLTINGWIIFYRKSDKTYIKGYNTKFEGKNITCEEAFANTEGCKK